MKEQKDLELLTILEQKNKDNSYKISDSYDQYYSSGIYQKRYNDTTNKTSSEEVIGAAIKIIEKKTLKLQKLYINQDEELGLLSKKLEANKLRILDFGCGDGRFFNAVIAIGQEAKKRGIEIEFIAYDISKTGLEDFTKKMLKFDFDLTDRNDNNWKLTKDNLTINFVLGNEKSSPQQIAQNVGDVDMTMCMFGVLSHIYGRENRVNLMKMFAEITNKDGEVVISVPSKKRFSQEQKHYDFLISEQKIDDIHGIKMEPGDLFYTRKENSDVKVQNYYHVYSSEELKEDLTKSGLVGQIKTDHVLDETRTTQNNCWKYIDRELAKFSTNYINNYFADYYLVSAVPQEDNFLEVIKKGEKKGCLDYLVSCCPSLRALFVRAKEPSISDMSRGQNLV